jgi:hypothetical protein
VDHRQQVAGAVLLAALLLSSGVSAVEQKRQLPDYGNCGKDPTTVGGVAMWVPRIMLSPL